MDIIFSPLKRKISFGISAVLIVISIIALSIWGLNIGIDFAGGTLLELQFNNQDIGKEQVIDTLNELDFAQKSTVQPSGEGKVLIRTKSLETPEITKLKSHINEKVGEYSEVRLETVGPTVGADLTNKAIWAVVLAAVFIILYIAYAFYKIPKPASSWRFGVAAVLALVHDIIITVGIFCILGHFMGYEINAWFIVAILTVMGFSVHDSIVVFDRIRENLKRFPSKSFMQNANDSVTQTLARSLNTSITLVLVLVALLFLGGESIQSFIVVLLVGVVIGTYSSIFTASPILIVWQNMIEKRRK